MGEFFKDKIWNEREICANIRKTTLYELEKYYKMHSIEMWVLITIVYAMAATVAYAISKRAHHTLKMAAILNGDKNFVKIKDGQKLEDLKGE